MSTIYNFDSDTPALVTGGTADILFVHDASAGVKKRITVANLATRFTGAAASSTVGFYGVTAVNQGTMTATALTAIATTTFSASNTGAGVFGFATSTAGEALVKRVSQIQADLETLMGKIDSTGLISISGV